MGNYPAPIRRPSLPTVIPLIALFVALGGTPYAAGLDTAGFRTE
jgi:hypothetical protein